MFVTFHQSSNESDSELIDEKHLSPEEATDVWRIRSVQKSKRDALGKIEHTYK